MNIQEDVGIFSQCISRVQTRANQLFDSSRQGVQQHPQLMLECLEELRIALEELHVAEEELRQQNQSLLISQEETEAERQRYRELFEFAPDGYLVTDPYSVVQEVNRSALTLLNAPVRGVMARPLVLFVPEEDRKTFRNVLNQLHRVNRIEEWEVYLLGQDGSPFQASLTVEVVRDSDGQPVSLRWLMRDITARKQAEERMRQIQLENMQLVEADQLKSQFIATLSHELRTPMQAILGFSQLLQRYFHADLDPQPFSMVERIVRNGQNLLTMIEEMLDFSRLEAHRMQLHPEPLDLAELASTTLEEMRSLAEQKGLRLQSNLPQSSVLVINDRTRLRQVIVNLLSNSIKFTEAGRITLEIWEMPEAKVVITVRDTGIGIAPANLDHIFKKFWQVNQSTTRRQGGTGLGLSITHAIVQLMQGQISVESQPEKGTTFRVELPRWLEPSVAIEETPSGGHVN